MAPRNTGHAKKLPTTSAAGPCKSSSARSRSDEQQWSSRDARDDNLQRSPSSDQEEEKKGTKRNVEDAGFEGGMDFLGKEMQKTLELFGADITKTILAKRKKLEQYTNQSLKTSNHKVDIIWKQQQAERQKLGEEFKRQVSGVFQQWESDVEKGKEQEEKLQNLFRQQQKLFQQARIIQQQRLKSVRQLYETYQKGMDDLEKVHQEQQTSVHSEIRKEMGLLQKRILMDTQQQEMANVRKSLQTMLF